MVLEHFTAYSTKNWPREEVRLAQAAAFTGSRDLWVLTAPIDAMSLGTQGGRFPGQTAM